MRSRSNVGRHHLIHLTDEVFNLTLHAVHGCLLLLYGGLLLLHSSLLLLQGCLLPNNQLLEVIHILGGLTPNTTHARSGACGGACDDINRRVYPRRWRCCSRHTAVDWRLIRKNTMKVTKIANCAIAAQSTSHSKYHKCEAKFAKTSFSFIEFLSMVYAFPE